MELVKKGEPLPPALILIWKFASEYPPAEMQTLLFQGEMHVGAQIVDPELLRPRFLVGSRFAIEEKDVRFDPLRVEDTGGQAQQRMHVCLLEQFAADRLIDLEV